MRRGEPPRPVEFSLDDSAAPSEAAAAAEAALLRQRESLEALVASHRHRLGEAFEQLAPKGRVGVQAWCEVMRRTLGLDIDWALVQPEARRAA